MRVRTAASTLAAALLLAMPVDALAGTQFPQTIVVRAPHARLVLETARTEAARRRGLMGRRSLAARHGMLFVFDGDAPRYFWMKDTLIPLDMVFVAHDGRVDSVAENVPAEANGVIARRSGVATYVIELGARQARAAGIAAGTRLVIAPR